MSVFKRNPTIPIDKTPSYQEILQNHVKSEIHDFLSQCKRDPSSFVYQSDLLKEFNSNRPKMDHISGVTFGKHLTAYLKLRASSCSDFGVKKKRYLNRYILTGLTPDNYTTSQVEPVAR